MNSMKFYFTKVQFSRDITKMKTLLKGQYIRGKAVKFFMISLLVKLLMYRKFTIIYKVYN